MPLRPTADGAPRAHRAAGGNEDANLALAASLIGMSEEELYIRIHMDLPALSAPQVAPSHVAAPVELDAIGDAMMLESASDPSWTLVSGAMGASSHLEWPPDYVFPEIDSEVHLRGMPSVHAASQYSVDAPNPLFSPPASAQVDFARPRISHPASAWVFEPPSSAAESAFLQHLTPPASARSFPTPSDQPHASDSLPSCAAAALASSESSDAIATPTTGSSPALSASPPRPDPELHGSRATWDVDGPSSRLSAQNGPLSKEWTVPKKTRRRVPSSQASRKRKCGTETSEGDAPVRPRKRGRFKTEYERSMTALTRKNKCCIRCRMLRDQCKPDPGDPQGVCIRCRELQLSNKAVMCKLPCLRWIITDSSLYREQERPYQMFSQRWQSMDLVDIDTWASPQTRTVVISQIFLDAPYPVEVREFVPVEGDMLEEMWTTSNSVVKRHSIPRYAISDIQKTATVLEAFIDRSIGAYINGALHDSDALLWTTYYFAFTRMVKAKTPKEQDLLRNCFRLWVGCLKTSHPEHICGDDKLGAESVDDPESIFHNVVPMPVIMIAQMECIMYTRVLRPMTRAVLRALNELVLDNKPAHWLTIYLTMFILFHCCSIITRRDWEFARQCSLRNEFANPESIRKHQVGMQVMLAHFHYLNKGVAPFSLTYDSEGLGRLSKAAELDRDEVEFISQTAKLIREPFRSAEMSAVLETNSFRHDLYWVSQLYVQDWKPGPTAL